MAQLELFSETEILAQSNNKYLGVHDWELESEENLFDNRTKLRNDKSFEENKELFDNTNNLTELAVSEYSPGGTAGKGNYYYRFSYRQGRRTKHIHIKGGNTTNPLAIKRKGLVEAWIRENISLEKIIEWIKAW